jgi:hypothetical protein
MTEQQQESRLVSQMEYPKIVYLEGLLFFFGANFLYHQNVFRANQNRLQFLGFLLVNAFTSYQLAEATNIGVSRHYAAAYNNTLEYQHRAALNAKLRIKLFGRQQTQQ